MQKTLELLCSQTAPSGFEAPVAQVAAQLLEPLMDQVTIDRMGNVIGVRYCGKENAKKLLLDAHLDEIGLIVTAVEEGFLRFRSIGGVDPRILPDQELMILTTPPIFGVVSNLPPHVQKTEDTKQMIPLSELMVDIGMSHEEATRTVPIGTPMVFRNSCFSLGEEYLCGKALDDRACFAALLSTAELLRQTPLDVDLYILGSVGEELSSALGAKSAAFSIAPDWCVAVDVTHGKTPDGPKEGTFPLGSGPVIGIGPNMTSWMTQRMKEKAHALKIGYQLEVMSGSSGTNGWHFQVSRNGIPTAVLSLPLKYMHSPIEVLKKSDLEQLSMLLTAFASNLGEEAKIPC